MYYNTYFIILYIKYNVLKYINFTKNNSKKKKKKTKKINIYKLLFFYLTLLNIY